MRAARSSSRTRTCDAAPSACIRASDLSLISRSGCSNAPAMNAFPLIDMRSVDYATMAEALQGIRVIDCSTVIAGPRIAMYLADFGADVIKVEHPQRGDDARHFGTHRDGVSFYWKLVSRNKRHITLDLSKGPDLARKLFATADILIENFRPGTLERWGLAPDTLDPQLIVVRVTGFGQT